MKVNLTAQVLSHKVAAEIFTLVKTNFFNEKAMPNALFIKKMDAIFNTMNNLIRFSLRPIGNAIFNTMNNLIRFSSRPKGNAKTSENICPLKDAIEILKNIKPVNGRKLPFLNGWIITLSRTI